MSSGLRTCSKCEKPQPLDEFYPLGGGRDGRMAHCRTCNNRRPPTEARTINSRARNRAYAELVKRHPDEFATILEEHRVLVAEELDQLRAVVVTTRSHDVHLPRIKPGPKRSGETSVLDRIDVARCSDCHAYHDRGHACLACGSHPSTDQHEHGDWRADALCPQVDTEIFFPEKGGSTAAAKRICGECPVAEQCLQYAVDHGERFGIWGGKSERERRQMERRTA